MTQIVLEVPFVTQLGFGDPSNLKSDPTGCWYASACMIGYFFGAGPRFGAPELYKPGLGHYANGKAGAGHEAITPGTATEDRFLKAEGLERMPNPTGNQYSIDQLATIIRQYGPVAFYLVKNHGGSRYGHVAVLIGLIGNNVVYHDPENAPRSTMTIGEFNSVLAWNHAQVLLRRSGPAFQATPKAVQVTLVNPSKPKTNMASNLKGTGFLGRLLR